MKTLISRGDLRTGNVLHDIYGMLKRSEKEMLIKQSGSTPKSHNERVRSAQSYLYNKYGMEREVTEVRFKKEVSGAYLNQAIFTAIKRYPYFSAKLNKIDGDFYIIQNTASLVAKETKALAILGRISRNYRLVDITY